MKINQKHDFENSCVQCSVHSPVFAFPESLSSTVSHRECFSRLLWSMFSKLRCIHLKKISRESFGQFVENM